MGAEITTPSGRIEGDHERGVRVFRGIPYARPPTEGLRWRPPERIKPWSGVRRGVRFAPSAPQPGAETPFLRAIVPATSAQSEDCLYLNVWTPAADGGRRPVMVWIHGGAFVMGSSATRLYSGARLARNGDVVVVTLNYRLGALGFLNLRGLGARDDVAPANLGLLDQIAALQWVRENIEAFGGDPERVTLFGESAGGMSVATLMGTPRARGMFRQAICQSGAAHNVSSRELGAAVARHFLNELGVAEPDAEALRKIRVSEILRAQRAAALSMRLPLGTLAWQPSLDGEVLPEAPLDAIRSGAASGVSLLVGANLDEWKLFMLGDRKGLRMDAAGLRRRLQRALPGRDASGRPLGERAFETYRSPDRMRPGSAPSDRWAAFQGDRVFHAPAQRLADQQATHAPTYGYLFAWTLPLLGARLGAFHGLEIPFVFGTLREPWLRPLVGLAPGARRLSGAMQQAWLHFARTGHPGHSALPYWPRWKPPQRSTLVFGPRCSLEEAPFETTLRFWDDLL
jgi:para-nitrobenzyl esterase